MTSRILVALSVLLLAGCEYSLRIPFPKLEKYERASMIGDLRPTVDVQPSTPALGEAVTLTFSGLEPGFNYSVYLSYGEAGGGDPDMPSPSNVAPYYKVGNLVPVDKVASVSFEVRSTMGNDQNGVPFKLSKGQIVTFMLKRASIDKTAAWGTTSGGNFSFLIK